SYIEEEHLRDLVQTQEDKECETVELQDSDLGEDMLSAEISGPVDADKAPVIRFVDLVLGHAVKSNASDIHLEPQDRCAIVRMRVDGRLRDMVPPSWKMYAAVVTRVKILSQMNIAERRLPQDGRFKIKAPGRDIDVRVSVIPVIYGEKVVMRILDKSSINHDIASLGFDEGSLETFKSILKQPHGIVVVTGPTGSGKSTTLYSALNYLKDPTKNITTVEDPVEYRMAGVNQIQVKPEIGLDFAASLRAILRQDPDIILIGEIRDRETVEIAIKASLTGHLVLSTFHTNDAPSTLTRLSFMGVDKYLLASTINLVVAQRLIRRICSHCKEEVKLDRQVLQRLRIDEETAGKTIFYHGRGCNMCGDSGYSGRVPIFEFMVMTAEIRSAVVNNMSESEIRKLARKNGHGGLLECGVRRLVEGVTTAEEVLNTTFSEDIE
ncbi:MAG: type II/IV secretion system protein, partial [Planctomycetes bacterium]|nr:type II/IV secretion system protein [Planctomycetota bacterium]